MKFRYDSVKYLPSFYSRVDANFVEQMPTICEFDSAFTKKRLKANYAIHCKSK